MKPQKNNHKKNNSSKWKRSMAKDREKKQQRSERVQRILDGVPHLLIRTSTIVLAVLYSLAAVAALWWWRHGA